ncbi:MAG: hypothetical protein DI599_03805 [Pseudomonas kuykendallii]|uniref:NB-ARC domain-containing protein n=1 Tax=Pseudomonas kuykendallii TaxID=1007099 RepID=A0A2W5F0H0_9PSED|nr:MAG: hypothetical protein DI599_03805 [Pseudomonas kuykendallii]
MQRKVASRRLISIVGPGGVGKTTVALRVAQQSLGRFRDGVRFIDLSTLETAEQLPSKVATELGLETGEDEPAGADRRISPRAADVAGIGQLRAPDRRLRQSGRGPAARGAGGFDHHHQPRVAAHRGRVRPATGRAGGATGTQPPRCARGAALSGVPPVRSPGQGASGGFRPAGRGRPAHLRNMPAPGRHAAGARAGGGTGRCAGLRRCSRLAGQPRLPRRPRPTHCAGPAADPARLAGLELRPAGRRGARLPAGAGGAG